MATKKQDGGRKKTQKKRAPTRPKGGAKKRPARRAPSAGAKASAATLKRVKELHRTLGAEEYAALVARAEEMQAQELPAERIAASVDGEIKGAGLELSVGVVVIKYPEPA